MIKHRKNCPKCGNYYEHRRNIFCSARCSKLGKNNPNYKPKSIMICLMCSKKFKVIPTRSEGKYLAKYCSRLCTDKATQKRMILKNPMKNIESAKKVSEKLKKIMPIIKHRINRKNTAIAARKRMLTNNPMKNKEIAHKSSIMNSLKWKNKDWAKFMYSKIHANPNKCEIKLNNFLQEKFPNEWKFVGDGSIIIEGKNPDFININGKKLIIELFGDYFHKRELNKNVKYHQTKKGRINFFKKYGYNTLIIWDKEIKYESSDLFLLYNKIKKFMEVSK